MNLDTPLCISVSVNLYIEYNLFKLYSLSSSTPLSSAEHLQLTVRCKFSELISWKLLPSANHTKSRFMLIPPIGPITMYRRVGGLEGLQGGTGVYTGCAGVCRVCRVYRDLMLRVLEGCQTKIASSLCHTKMPPSGCHIQPIHK